MSVGFKMVHLAYCHGILSNLILIEVMWNGYMKTLVSTQREFFSGRGQSWFRLRKPAAESRIARTNMKITKAGDKITIGLRFS